MNARALALVAGSLLLSVGCSDTAGPALDALLIVTESLPSARPNIAYNATLEASGGDLDYAWILSSGSGPLPAGLSLASGGAITGTPTAGGIFDFDVVVTSGDGQGFRRGLSIRVSPVLQAQELCSNNPDYAIGTFEDPRLEALVRPQVQFYVGVSEDADLTCGRLSQVLALGNGTGETITSLLGLQNLRGMTFLSLNNGTSITDLGPLVGFTGLTELSLGGNSITDLSPLAGLTGLTDLFLGLNLITDLGPLAGLTSLTELGVSDNSVTNLDALSGLTALRRLRALDTRSTTSTA